MGEPHATRRKEIVKAHPQIKKLFGHCPRTKWVVLLSVTAQLVGAYLVRDLFYSQPLAWFLATYTFSGTINHMMTLAVHELAHNLGFKKPLWNRLCAIFANLPMAIPAAVSFRRYHLEHHRYQGDDVMDVDVPTYAEGYIVGNNVLAKTIWMFFQPLFYSLRPLFVAPKKAGAWELVNLAAVVAFDLTVYKAWGMGAFLYLFLGTLLGMGLHPVAGHFIAEHYVFIKGQETYSYYGPLNWVAFNVGYHNEHHDFPFIPGSRLPLVRALAPELQRSPLVQLVDQGHLGLHHGSLRRPIQSREAPVCAKGRHRAPAVLVEDTIKFFSC